MAEVLLFPHERGLTPGVIEFADRLRADGHKVHIPDLFEGRTFASLDEGMAYVDDTGFDTVVARGLALAETLPSELVYAGFSLGVIPAEALAVWCPGARGVLLFNGIIPLEFFGGEWPAGVPLQIHISEADGFGDDPRELAQTVPGAKLFQYEADGHLFADSSLPSFDKHDADLLTNRVLRFLKSV